jgi:hypothetical protein
MTTIKRQGLVEKILAKSFSRIGVSPPSWISHVTKREKFWPSLFSESAFRRHLGLVT